MLLPNLVNKTSCLKLCSGLSTHQNRQRKTRDLFNISFSPLHVSNSINSNEIETLDLHFSKSSLANNLTFLWSFRCDLNNVSNCAHLWQDTNIYKEKHQISLISHIFLHDSNMLNAKQVGTFGLQLLKIGKKGHK